MVDVDLTFLGTGGGRFVMFTQKRWTGGIRIVVDKFHMHLDPGPGAIVRSIETGLSPQKVRAIFVSHSHPDHYTDAEIFVEAMTSGMTKRQGVLVGSHSVLFGNDVCEASVSKYHQGIVERVIEAKPGEGFTFENVEVMVAKAVHSDPDTVGFKFNFPEVGSVSYTSDTQYFEEIGDYYRGTRLLLLCVMRPRGFPWKGHMSTEDAVKIVNQIKPKMVIITHFGMKMVFSRPDGEAKYIEQETGVPTIAALDGMRVKVGGEIQILKRVKGQKRLSNFFKDRREKP